MENKHSTEVGERLILSSNAHTDVRTRLVDSTSGECLFSIPPLPGPVGGPLAHKVRQEAHAVAPRRD